MIDRNNGCYTIREDVNVLALVKKTETSIFFYDNASRVEALRTLGRFASNPEFSFTWYDAAVLSQKMRQEAEKPKMLDDLLRLDF